MLDWAVSTFDVQRMMLTKESYKFDYAWDPPITDEERERRAALGQYPEKNLNDPRITPVFHTKLDPPVGPETEAFFDGVANILATQPQSNSTGTSYSLADLNMDGVVSTTDFRLFQSSLGACLGTPRFHLPADLDGDGCITFRDYQIWLPVYQERVR
jgi:hypothetical protein